MIDVFLSYVRRDKARVALIVDRLRQAGFQVWWDDDIPPDAPWEATIEQALEGARSVVVCWSSGSVASENVRSEARWAKSRGKLVQLFLDQCDPPLFFGERQGVDLIGWHGDPQDARFVRLTEKLAVQGRDRPPVDVKHSDVRPLSSANKFTWRARMLSIAVGGLLTLGIGAWWIAHASPGSRGNRIAVLPFETLSADATTTVLARGLGDQIITALNSSDVPALSRDDAATIRGTDNTARLNELNVALVFDGTVESDGKTLDVKVHVNDPFAHTTLWTGSATGPLADVARLRSQLTRTVVGVLACSNRALQPDGLSDPTLLGRYLRACDLFVNGNDASEATAMYEMLDNLRIVTRGAPKFAAAHSDLAKFDAYLAPIATATEAAVMRKEAAGEADAALALDPKAADAYLARELLLAPNQWSQREALLRKGIAIAPNWPHTNGFLAIMLQETGRMHEATDYAAHAAAADLQIDWVSTSAELQCNAGKTNETIDDLRDRLSKTPGDDALTSALGECLLDAGRFHEVRVLDNGTAPVREGSLRDVGIKAGETRNPTDLSAARLLALKNASDGPSGQASAIQWLSQLGFIDDAFAVATTFRPGYPMTATGGFLFGPRTAAMRRDPRFRNLMASYGELNFWRSSRRWPDFCGDRTLPYRCG